MIIIVFEEILFRNVNLDGISRFNLKFILCGMRFCFSDKAVYVRSL